MSTATAPQSLPRPSPRLPSLARVADHPRAWLLLLPWCGFLFFYGLGTGDLYRTEGLRAIVAQEFLNSGNWVVPTLYGEPLLTKPPGMYAAIAAVSVPFGGVSDWSARLPSALAATATVFLFFWYFCRVFGPRGGLVAGFIVPASVMWLDKATAAEIDMTQALWVAGSVLFFLRALEEEESAKPRAALRWWLAALLCVAGGVLTKWTAPAFFYLTVIPLLWWRGRLRLVWGRNHLVAAALGAALCLTWAALAVRQAGWDVFANTVSQEAMQRLVPHEIPLAAGRHHHRPYPWGEVLGHPFVVLGSAGPWSFFALVALWPGFAKLWDERGRRLLQALHCWAWPNLLFWTVVPEHAPRHSFPLFPALAGLAALVWLAWLTGRLRWYLPRVSPGRVFVGLLAAWLVVKVGYVHAWVPVRDGRANHLLRAAGFRERPTRDTHGKGERLAALVPAGRPLYLFHVKDEGIMFCYGRCHPDGQPDRVVRRLGGPNDLPDTAELVYCIVTEAEWGAWDARRPAEVLLRLPDQQGDPMVLLAIGQEASRR
ncbi:MAG TPA: glycosyltransferase family 39 protein, partial [Gemmataceae bacterium]|nr:glycosyltransferase family 39 protein [Gemmataceae bacterium]